MSILNYKSREMIVKIVYYGPGVGGKTTSIQRLHEKTIPERKGELYFLATEADQTIYFELLPLYAGEIKNFKLRFQVYTVPGQVKYNNTRKAVLQGADAIVFVADSQRGRRQANMVSLKNLEYNLKGGYNVDLKDLPMVYEYNKRDMKDILTIEELQQDLNPRSLPYFETIATEGTGVLEAFEEITSLAIEDVEKKLDENDQKTAPAGQGKQKKPTSKTSPAGQPPPRPVVEEDQNFFVQDDDVIGAAHTTSVNSMMDDVIGESDIITAEDIAPDKQPAAPEIQTITFPDGGLIFEAGQQGDEMYFVEEGQVRIIGRMKNQDKGLATYRKGEFFGDMVLFGGRPRTARAVAVGETRLIPVRKDALASQIGSKPEIAPALLKAFSGRIQHNTQSIAKLQAKNRELMKRFKQAQDKIGQLVKQNTLLKQKFQAGRKKT